MSEQIGIFYPEVKDIATKMNITEADFIIKDTVPDEFRLSMREAVHPIFDSIYYQNIRFKLKTVNDFCVFLSDTGCTLPNDIRPVYCRIYPFFPSKQGDKYITVLSSHECLAQNKSTNSWTIVNEHFGYSHEYLQVLFAKMNILAEMHIQYLT
ncbi:MAG: hypothetical protein FWG20_02710 [Candidatus Cloacimonetes bacterium]|nr:hypothetical protein [Candidatus Cloacimonadota bacterium]